MDLWRRGMRSQNQTKSESKAGKSRLLPIFGLETCYPPEFPGVVSNENRPVCHCDGANQEIVRTNGRTEGEHNLILSAFSFLKRSAIGVSFRFSKLIHTIVSGRMIIPGAPDSRNLPVYPA